MGGKILFIFVAIVVVGIGLYIYQSGVIGNSINYLNTLASRSSTPPVYSPSPSSGPAPSIPASPPSPPPSTPAINPADIPPGFTASQLSPYFHQVRFGGISGGSSGQISLYTNFNQTTQAIDVTGWQIKSNRGGEYIPQAVDPYDPSGVLPAIDIRLKSGDYVNIYSSSAPVNLRLNKCMGYLPNKTQFNPQLPQSCPYIDRSNIQNLSGACQNYIYSLGGCQSPDFGSSNFPRNDYACEDYLRDRYTYKWCFNTYLSDPDFSSHEIRVWMGSNPVDQFHDVVLLFDKSGLLVDYYSY
jgi:hypothetical protein